MNTYGRYALAVSSGKGTKLYDVEGKEYLDFAAGIATCCLGHSSAALKQAVLQQMDKVHHCSNLYYIPEQAKLAKWLVSNSCADKVESVTTLIYFSVFNHQRSSCCDDCDCSFVCDMDHGRSRQVFFCNSGAEANEAAIKLARKYAHTRLEGVTFPVIVTAKNSFHGRTLTAITATGQPKYQKNFAPLTPGFEYVEYNNAEELRSVVEAIRSRGGGCGLAAIMMEPLQGEGGIRPGEKAFFAEARRLCDETGALLIVDEVQTGVGRTVSSSSPLHHFLTLPLHCNALQCDAVIISFAPPCGRCRARCGATCTWAWSPTSSRAPRRSAAACPWA